MTLNTETLDAAIGRRGATARNAVGYNAIQVAARLNLSEVDYRARETGHERFRSRELSILAKLFSIEVRSLFEDEGAGAAREFALADWIEASRHREGLAALLQSEKDAAPDPLRVKAA